MVIGESATLIFGIGDSLLSIEITLEENRDLPNHGDARLEMAAESAGFSGAASCWVDRDVLASFTLALQRMAHTLTGTAELQSTSPGELSLQIYPLSSRGVFGVEGQIGRGNYGQEKRFWHSINFGFAVEYSQIEKAASQLKRLTAK